MFIMFYYQTFRYFRYYLSGKDMTQQNYDGRTALHVAAAQGKGNLSRLKGLAIHILRGYHSRVVMVTVCTHMQLLSGIFPTPINIRLYNSSGCTIIFIS